MAPIPDEQLVSELIAQQFPQFAGLTISRLDPDGWDNISFRLGETMLVKVPRDPVYAGQPKREREALNALSDKLPLAIPRSIALGAPSELCPNHWSILEWIEGETVAYSSTKARSLPEDLARFLRVLHDLAPSIALSPEVANFWRGGSLSHQTAEFEAATVQLGGKMDMKPVLAVWAEANACEQPARKCWVHGDIAPANLLQRDGKLCAAIDFGLASAGDPACDLAIAWFAFDSSERGKFLQTYGTRDRDLLLRARAWALWKAVLILAEMSRQPPAYLPAQSIINAICRDRPLANG